MRLLMLMAVASCWVWNITAAWGVDARGLIQQGTDDLAQNRLHEAAEAFRGAIDIDPSSAKAHELLGVTLSRELFEGTGRVGNEADTAQRAEDNFKRALELSPPSSRTLIEYADLEGGLAARAADPDTRAEQYESARDLLKQAMALNPNKTELYLQLASLERDDFGPDLQQAKQRAARDGGPIGDVKLRHQLQQQYGSLLDDAISNAQKAVELNVNTQKATLMMFRLLQERALIRETPEEYSSDMHAAEDWRRQFFNAGGHVSDVK